jgi:hypothetical protein
VPDDPDTVADARLEKGGMDGLAGRDQHESAARGVELPLQICDRIEAV